VRAPGPPVLLQVGDRVTESRGVILEMPHAAIAWRAQQPPHPSRRVIVIDMHTRSPDATAWIGGAADRTPSTLRVQQAIELLGGDAVVADELIPAISGKARIPFLLRFQRAPLAHLRGMARLARCGTPKPSGTLLRELVKRLRSAAAGAGLSRRHYRNSPRRFLG